MIKAISFDLYNTLVQFWPPLDEVQQAACQELGLNVCKSAINKGYAVADVYFNEENGRHSLGLRSAEERLDFFARYQQLILENAGVPVSLGLAREIWSMAMTIPKDFVPFEDTIPALEGLRSQGYRLGVLSNLRRDMDELCEKIGLSPYLDFCISPAEAGGEKPNPAMFLEALKRVSASPAEAVHVGDQYGSDVQGARGVGMHGVLIDRGGHRGDVTDCPKIASLAELGSLLEGAPNSLSNNHH